MLPGEGLAAPESAKVISEVRGVHVRRGQAGRTSLARLSDLLIAATAAANGLPLYSRNPSDFSGLERILSVKAV
jgi:predicted nucleic acid-binding protein